MAFVFLWEPTPPWLLFSELKNKACHYSLIVAKFREHNIQVKDNEIVDSGSLKGDRVTGDRYMQVNVAVNIRDDLWEVVQ